MSWVRWSSDDFRSDVYVYESDEGVTIHVAANRHVRDENDNITDKTTPINGLWDGVTYVAHSEAEAYRILHSLQDDGYHIPSYVFLNEPEAGDDGDGDEL